MALPESIDIYETERDAGLVHEDLDWPYIDGVATDVAAILASPGASGVAEVCYQPGDGTRYPLVFTPLRKLQHARPRTWNGQTWERHAVSGMASADRADDAVTGAEFYDPRGYLVSRVEGASYPIRLGGGRGHLAASYVGEHWNARGSSACALAILFRAVSFYLNRWEPITDGASDVQVLLDGLEVGSVAELHRLIDRGREADAA